MLRPYLRPLDNDKGIAYLKEQRPFDNFKLVFLGGKFFHFKTKSCVMLLLKTVLSASFLMHLQLYCPGLQDKVYVIADK